MAGLGEATQNGGEPPALSLNGRSPALSPWRATFVTLTESERLRGCIGSPAPRRPLIADAIANAAQAGFADPRFPRSRKANSPGSASTSQFSPIRDRSLLAANPSS